MSELLWAMPRSLRAHWRVDLKHGRFCCVGNSGTAVELTPSFPVVTVKSEIRNSMQKRPTHDRRRRPRLADPIHRMTTRWRSGGVEQYPLGKDETHRTLKRMGSAFEITQHNIRLEILPEAFQGFRIIQLTDIHHGVFLPGEMLRHVVETVNEMEPDLVAVTGDFVTYSRAYIDPVAEILAHVKARHGVFAVLGNHDFRVGPDEITESLERAGISSFAQCAHAIAPPRPVALSGRYRRLELPPGPAEGHSRHSKKFLDRAALAQSCNHSSGRAGKNRPRAFGAHSRRASKFAVPRKYLGTFARAASIQSRLGPLGTHANLCQPRNRHDRVAAAISLPRRNSAAIVGIVTFCRIIARPRRLTPLF